jgi:hypothetical protein
MTSAILGLAALLLAGPTNAQDIKVKWIWNGDTGLSHYLPKVASDGIQNVVSIAQTVAGFSTIEAELGVYQPLQKEQVKWTGIPDVLYKDGTLHGGTYQIGHAPSIALGFDTKNYYDDEIVVYQGDKDNESSLWFQLGSNLAFPFSGIKWGPATQLGPGHQPAPILCPCPVVPYDNGYNPTVAADLNGPSSTSTTVVEVHQSDKDESTLYYHVGLMTLGKSPSITWGPSLAVDQSITLSGIVGAQGYAPTVSVSNNVAVLVAQGSLGTLWYSVGVVDTAKSTIAWTAPTTYGSGYRPTVSVLGDSAGLWISGQVLVEAHQVDNDTGSLRSSVGVLNGSSPTSIIWSVDTSGTADTNIRYADGCYPSVALGFGPYAPSDVTVTETHLTACGSAGTTQFSFGYLK